MIEFLKSRFGKTSDSKKIFEKAGVAQPNFKIVATHIREGKNPKNYLLDEGDKLPLIVEKWRFEPKDSIGRCGYDYNIFFTNGEINIPISVCFLCNTLIFNNSKNYKISKKKIMTLLREDFKLI
jgi:hypothetical protein